MTPDQKTPRPPTQLGHHTLLEQVGHGLRGTAYRARDTALGRTVLVRDVHDLVGRDSAARDALLTQARAATAVSHPNVATLFEVGEALGECFLVYEFVAGDTLDEAQGGEPLGIKEAVDLGVQIAEALAAVHAAGLLHLDVRPDTIKFSRLGQGKLLGLGLGARARVGEPDSGGSAGATAPDAGLARYWPPEQRANETLDARSDLFSLGKVLHEMLTGKPPVDDADASPSKPSAINPEVPAELDAIVERATRRRPTDRYQSAAPLAAELRSFAAMLEVRNGDREPPSHRGTAARRPASTSRREASLVVVAVAVLGLAAWLWLAP